MNSNKLLFFVLILAVCLTQVASDIYTPSLPAIAINLHTSIDLTQWSLAIYMLGVAVSQLFYGPISEGIGRRAPLIVGLNIMLVGTLICLFSPNIYVLIFGRLIQGCGAGSCAALWRSVFRDVYTGEELSKYASYLVIFVTFIVPAAPLLGGYLQEYIGWRSTFIFMSVYTIVALSSVIYGFRETSQHHHKDRLQLSYIASTFRMFLTHRIFMGITLCSFLAYGAFFAWVTAAPVLLIHILKLTPATFGWITFIGGGTTYIIAGRLNGRWVSRFGMPNMIRFALSVMILSGIMMLIGYFLFGINVYAIVTPILVFYFGSTFLWPNAFATAFSPFGKVAGYAGALYGFMQVFGASVMGGVISYLPDKNQLTLAIVIISASFLAWVTYELAITLNPKKLD